MIVETFKTPILHLNLNTSLNLKKEIKNIKKKEGRVISNVGGYQGHEFYNEEWYKIICKKIPFREGKPIKNFMT